MIETPEGLTRQARRCVEALLMSEEAVALMADGCTVADLAGVMGWSARYVKIGLSALEGADLVIRARPNDVSTGASLPSTVTLRPLTPAA